MKKSRVFETFCRISAFFDRTGCPWGALLCGLVYGVASGFGLPTMIDQVFPKIFPTQAGATAPLSFWQLFLYVSVFPAVFLIRGLSGYFNTYLINFCGIRVLEQIRIQVFEKIQRLPVAFSQESGRRLA